MNLPDRRRQKAFQAQAKQQEHPICVNCGHTKEAHWDRYGCQVEGGDVWVDGTNFGAWMASGPCCCKDFKSEEAAAQEDAQEVLAKAIERQKERIEESYLEMRADLHRGED